MHTTRIPTRLSWAAIVFMLGLLLPSAIFAHSAYAAGEVLAYEAGNGWTLSYTVSDAGEVTIEGLAAAGSGKLVVPAQIEGCDVVAFGDESFYNKGGSGSSASLAEIEIPQTVTTLGARAFTGSGLTSVSIPASVEELPAYCFAGCTSLASVTFEGDSIGCIGDSAFSGCTSLVRIDVPELTHTVGSYSYRMGYKCFYKCSKLETVVFHGKENTFDPDSKVHSGNINSSITMPYYVANIDCFDGCDSLKEVVYYCRKDKIPSGTGSRALGTGNYSDVAVYQTLAFYANAQDSQNCENLVYSITCRDTVKILDVLHGTVDAADVWDTWGTLPDLPAGMTWGVEKGGIARADSVLSDTYNVVPVARDDLAYGWVSAPYIDEFWNSSDSAPGMMGTQNYPTYYLDEQGKVFSIDRQGNVGGLADIVAYLPGGEPADAASYELRYQLEGSTQADRATLTSYTDVAVPNAVGRYRVAAVATSGASAGTQTLWSNCYIDVALFSPTINSYDEESAATRLGRASQVAASAVSKTAVCDVVVPASDWRYQLIGAGLAGVGQGVLLFDNGEDYSARTVNAFGESGVTALQIVGSTDVVPESSLASDEVYLMDHLNERAIQNKTRYSDDKTIQALADQVYSTIRRLQKSGNAVYGEGWGTTAIVMSAKNCVDTLPIAQYAYEQKAPVFFVQDDGTLSSTDLGYLASDGFTNIVVAGDSSYVSDACVQAIQSKTSIAPVRSFDAGSNSLEAALGYLASASYTPTNVSIAATNDPANTVAAALVAAAQNGVALPCSSTEDSKRIQDYIGSIMDERGPSSIAVAYLIGDFTNADPGIRTRVAALWTSPLANAVGVGDTCEVGDYVYELKSSSKVKCVAVRNPDLTVATVEDVAYGGKAYTPEMPDVDMLLASGKVEGLAFTTTSIKSIAKSAFAGKQLVSVDLGPHITSVGKGAFAGCTALEEASGAAVKKLAANAFAGCTALSSVSFSKAASVGASAFSGCAALKSVSLPAATSIGASVFKGSTALASAKLPKVKAVSASAFLGCAALKSFSSAKVTSIGKSAFEKCAKLTSATFTSASLKKIGAKAFNGCAKLKKLKLKTKKLTAKTVGAKAFTGTAAKMKVYVPVTKKAAYKKLFQKKGASKKAIYLKA